MVAWSRIPSVTPRTVLAWFVRVMVVAVSLSALVVNVAVVGDYQRDQWIRARLTQAGGKYHAGYAGPPSLSAIIAPRTHLLDRVLFVDLHSQRISIDVCRDLVALRSLRTLRLNHSTIDGEALSVLGSHPNLQVLELVRTDLDDEVLATISNCTQLTTLDIRNNDISDAGVTHLLRLTNLRVLSLGGTSVTDESVRRLKGVPSLLYVNLSSTQTTPQARSELRLALPKCRTWPDP